MDAPAFKEESMSLLDDPVIGKWLNEIYAPRLAEREAKREENFIVSTMSYI